MRRTVFSLLIFLAGCSTSAAITTTTAAVTTTTQPTTTVGGPTTSHVPATTTTDSVTTTTTQPPLRGLAYELVGRLDFPVQMMPWKPGFSMIATKDGRVWLYDGSMVSVTPVLDLRAQVRDRGEQGLLSIAIHPVDPNRVFAHYTANDGDTIVSEFTWENGSLVDELALLRLDQPASNHNGGMIQFGPDGFLYLGLGDGGGANDQFGNGQDQGSLLGGLVRIDVDGGGEPVLWQSGLRNPWRFWIDGDQIYIADVGQGSFEEVSVAPLGESTNYGWPIMEGSHCFRPSSGCDVTGLTLPVVEVPHGDAGTCSITGGIVYRGRAMPELVGSYFFSDYCGGYLRSFRVDGGVAVDEVDWTDQVGSQGRVVGFGVDGDGEMYVATTTRLLKVVPVR